MNLVESYKKRVQIAESVYANAHDSFVLFQRCNTFGNFLGFSIFFSNPSLSRMEDDKDQEMAGRWRQQSLNKTLSNQAGNCVWSWGCESDRLTILKAAVITDWHVSNYT